ncbi:hypothetical protein [Cytobacillus sp. NCCP-133]|uniref:hypothetical protein n=1 Tax=Cytobacillus sp. NCCP-133 TaxID=766848 RepID=UPI002230FAF4|nr:hypothetical protein [Cytobacillus sp. NCCP-133]
MKSWLSRNGSITTITSILHSKKGAAFSSVFNSFFSAFENLYPTPTEEDISRLAKDIKMKVIIFKPVVTEGGWYFIQLSNK